ncbi:MAG: glycosyltransferase family 4 protein [Pseudomonadota bacterium]
MTRSDNKPRTILQVIPGLTTGGAEKTTLDISRALVERGYISIVASSGGRMVEQLEAEGGTHITLPLASKNPFRMLANVFALKQIFRDWSVDLVHARSRAPAWSSFFAAKQSGLPFVTTYHGAYNEQNRLKSLYNSVMARADVVIANSQWTSNLITERYPWSSSQLHIIPRGTDLTQFNKHEISAKRLDAMRDHFGATADQRIILNLARLTPWKGQLVLVDAFSQTAADFPDTVLVLAGDAQGRDQYVKRIEELVQKHGLTDRVFLPGHCTDPAAAFAICDISVVASTEPEAFGRAATEAEALEIPVIVSDLGAVRETVVPHNECQEDQSTGWIVPHGDPQQLANAMQQALSLSTLERESMGARARRHVERNFSLEQMVEKTLQIYEELSF